MIPKRDYVLPTRLNHPPRVQQLFVSPSAHLGHGSSPRGPAGALEEGLPARAGAHPNLERSFRGQCARAAAGTGTGTTAARRVGRDDADEGLLDAAQRREAHAQTAQVVRQSLQGHELGA